MKKLLIWCAILALIAVVVVFFIRRNRKPSEEPYRVEVVEKGNVTMTVTATGTISAVTTVQVGSQVSGIIARLHADFNSPVRRGQLLAELDPTPFEARVEQRRAELLQAQVQMRRAQLDFDRQGRLLRDSLAAQSEFDTAKAEFEAASARVDLASAALRQAQTDLQYTRIVSPIDGVVVARQYDVGQTVAASFQAPTLFTIAQDLTKMQVQADVDQSDIGRIQTGQHASFTVDAYPEQEFHGTISQIRLNATANQNVITYPVILSVPNPDEKLRPQMTANVTIDVATVHDVLRVPNAALRFRPTQGEAAENQGGSDTRSSGSGTRRELEGGGRAARQAERSPSSVEQQAARMGERGGGFAAMAGQFDRAVAREGRGGRMQAVYVLEGSGALKRLSVRTGISDGKFTQVLEGELKPGDRVVVGQATARVETSPSRPPGPGGGRLF